MHYSKQGNSFLEKLGNTLRETRDRIARVRELWKSMKDVRIRSVARLPIPTDFVLFFTDSSPSTFFYPEGKKFFTDSPHPHPEETSFSVPVFIDKRHLRDWGKGNQPPFQVISFTSISRAYYDRLQAVVETVSQWCAEGSKVYLKPANGGAGKGTLLITATTENGFEIRTHDRLFYTLLRFSLPKRNVKVKKEPLKGVVRKGDWSSYFFYGIYTWFLSPRPLVVSSPEGRNVAMNIILHAIDTCYGYKTFIVEKEIPAERVRGRATEFRYVLLNEGGVWNVHAAYAKIGSQENLSNLALRGKGEKIEMIVKELMAQRGKTQEEAHEYLHEIKCSVEGLVNEYLAHLRHRYQNEQIEPLIAAVDVVPVYDTENNRMTYSLMEIQFSTIGLDGLRKVDRKSYTSLAYKYYSLLLQRALEEMNKRQQKAEFPSSNHDK